MPHDWIIPDWPAPARVGALLTTRNGGVSLGPFGGGAGTGHDGLNLRFGEGDEPRAVAENRARLARRLPAPPVWLRQVHGTDIVDVGALTAAAGSEPTADAALCRRPGVVCAVQTADCLPVLLCDRKASVVAVAHAGWRGLAAGVLEASVAALAVDAGDVLAYLGPAIGPKAFEVGEDVRDAFRSTTPGAEAAFAPFGPGKWLADLALLARLRLARLGVIDVHGGTRCTVLEPEHFYSFRRDRITGRMASLIWLLPEE
jgi:YfiH family protein